MSYDTGPGPSGRAEEYGPWGAEAFGASSITHQIIGPRGCVGFVRDMMVEVTASMVGTTTVPEIQVGISSGDFTYGRYRLGSSASLGYFLGMHRAATEQLSVALTNAGRQVSDYAGHVVLDGGTYTSAGTPGGTFGTVIPAGRIPRSMTVTNVISGTGSVARIFVKEQIDVNLKVGQVVNVLGVQGATASGMTTGNLINGNAPISAISISGGYIELSGTTFGGTYTGGGMVNLVVVITELLGVGGTPAGTGYVRVNIDWHGGDQM
jgi:hypothetical protein